MEPLPHDESKETVRSESIGGRLKRERLSKHLSIQEVAEATRVNLAALQALEDDDYDKLPARVFVQGFIRLYANLLNINPEEAIDHYKMDIDDTIDPKAKFKVRKTLNNVQLAEPPSFLSTRKILFIVLLCLLVFLIYLGRQKYYPMTKISPTSAKIEQTARPVPPPTKIVEEPAPATAVEEKVAEKTLVQPANDKATKQPLFTNKEYTLRANFIEKTWVWIKVDDQKPKEYLFQPGEHFKWVSHDKIDINLGNAGGVNFVLNDTPLPPIGISGQVVRLKMPDAARTILNPDAP